MSTCIIKLQIFYEIIICAILLLYTYHCNAGEGGGGGEAGQRVGILIF